MVWCPEHPQGARLWAVLWSDTTAVHSVFTSEGLSVAGHSTDSDFLSQETAGTPPTTFPQNHRFKGKEDVQSRR